MTQEHVYCRHYTWNKPQSLDSQPQAFEYRTGEGRLSQKRVSWVTMPLFVMLQCRTPFPRSTAVQRCLSIVLKGLSPESRLLMNQYIKSRFSGDNPLGGLVVTKRPGSSRQVSHDSSTIEFRCTCAASTSLDSSDVGLSSR